VRQGWAATLLLGAVLVPAAIFALAPATGLPETGLDLNGDGRFSVLDLPHLAGRVLRLPSLWLLSGIGAAVPHPVLAFLEFESGSRWLRESIAGVVLGAALWWGLWVLLLGLEIGIATRLHALRHTARPAHRSCSPPGRAGAAGQRGASSARSEE
jgi:hypothetical protein